MKRKKTVSYRKTANYTHGLTHFACM